MNRYLWAVFLMAAVTLLTRAAPFIFFSHKKVPSYLLFLQQYMPPIVMALLVINSFRTIDWTLFPHGLPALAGALLTAILHLWKRQVLLSIGGGTLVYMLLIRLL
ncbi:MAG: AzlD domain-containing protein [Spirochaetes bacterium]|nr:AzlD domain-containing protein [Spirochaetota bacterium]MBU0954338.1 AzlD domain-containing protein [Spirochaetota bacterium]